MCRRLWTEEVIEHHGEFFDFGPVMFEPKPVQKPYPPIHVGGDSDAALRRAARHDGWYGLQATPQGVAGALARLREMRRAEGRDTHRRIGLDPLARLAAHHDLLDIGTRSPGGRGGRLQPGLQRVVDRRVCTAASLRRCARGALARRPPTVAD